MARLVHPDGTVTGGRAANPTHELAQTKHPVGLASVEMSCDGAEGPLGRLAGACFVVFGVSSWVRMRPPASVLISSLLQRITA